MIETELLYKELQPFFCKPEESGRFGYHAQRRQGLERYRDGHNAV